MPQTYQTTHWRIQVPDTWKIDGSDLQVAIFRPDGVGILSIMGSDMIGRYDPLALARAHSPPGSIFTEASCRCFHGLAGVQTEGETLRRRWWLSCRGQLIQATYECAINTDQVEINEVDQILQSFDENDAGHG